MRVGLVVDELARGGTERQFALLACALADAGLDVGLFVLKPVGAAGQQHLQLLTAGGVAVASGGIRSYAAWMRRFRPDIVQVAMLRTSLIAAASTLRPGAPPLVMSRRYLASARRDSPLRTLATRASLQRAAAIIANSSMAALDSARVEGVPLARYTVIGNIVAPAAFEPVEPAVVATPLPLIVNVASLRPQKGHQHLIEAAHLLKAAGRPVTVLCLGDDQRWPETAADVRHRIAAADVDVRLLGDVPDPKPYLAAADVVVQASVAEGLSNSLLEAMAVGRPIVATDVGGTAEVLLGTPTGSAGSRHPEQAPPGGVVVPPAAPTALADAMHRLLAAPDQAALLGVNARARARSHDAATAVSAHLALFDKLLG